MPYAAAMRAILLLLAIVPCALASPAVAEMLPGPVPAAVVQVIDGDTLRVRARVWLGQDVETAVRIAGIDTPELRGAACEAERRLAEAARGRLAALLDGGAVRLREIEHGTFAGRVVARVETADGHDVGEPLLADGLARRYGGQGARGPWCP